MVRPAHLLAACLAVALLAASAALAAPSRVVRVVSVQGAVDPAIADYLARALDAAESDRAQALVIRLDTPGGLGNAMDRIVALQLNSRIPIVVYVAPAGATAFSAGTFITLAASFAVMHPGATIGAAHPLDLLGSATGAGGKQAEMMSEKVTNAYAKKARSIAESRGRNGDWAEEVVRNNATATAPEALKLGAVDAIQPTMAALLEWLDGRTTMVEGSSAPVKLRTRGARVEEVPLSVKDSFLHQLADPNILLILIVLAALGIIFELQNPGGVLPGVVGGIALLLALYSMSVLPVTTAGLALIAFAIVLLIVDIKVPSHGILTIGGVVAFIVGGLMLVDTRYAGVARMSVVVVIAMAVLLLGFFAVALGAVVRAHRRQPTTGQEGLIGAIGRALSPIAPGREGEIRVVGEHWRAQSEGEPIAAGQRVQVAAVDGLTLIVRPLMSDSDRPA